MLEQCEQLLLQRNQDELAVALKQASATQPLATPVGFKGPDATKMFKLCMPASVRHQIFQAIEQAFQAGETTPATAARGLGGFVEAWREYAAHV